jgi:hypothetical protein
VDAEAHQVERWMEAMRSGDFERAWSIADALLLYPAGRPRHHLPRHRRRVWDGTPLGGKRVLVRCHHGLGDTIHFIRYAPLLRTLAAEVTYWAQPELIPLLESAAGVDRVIPTHDAEPEVEREVDVEIMELPHVFRTTLPTLPRRIPYLHPEPLPRTAGTERAVGLVWRAGDWDDRRSLPFAALAPLLETRGVRWHLLQRGPGLLERPAGFGVASGSDDVLHTARLMRTLDLVITVDSMPAHLAGALGIPVWTLLHSDPDWRWMREREDSPWYPTMRLFRQREAGAWGPVVARVARELRGGAA